MTELLSDTARETMLEPLKETGWTMVEGRDRDWEEAMAAAVVMVDHVVAAIVFADKADSSSH